MKGDGGTRVENLVPRGPGRLLLDRLAFPALALMSRESSMRMGLTPVDDERVLACLPHVKGLLLDVGCGPNRLVRSYGRGVGVDVYQWDGVDVRCDTTRLPFPSATFGTAAMLASLNHIPKSVRDAVVGEIRRVLRADGVLLVTMIAPWIGRIVHRVRRGHDPDQTERGIHEDEDLGLTTAQVEETLRRGGFRVTSRRRFVYGLNNLYVARPA